MLVFQCEEWNDKWEQVMMTADADPTYMAMQDSGEFEKKSDANGHYASWLHIDA